MTIEQRIQQIIKNRTVQGFSPRAIAHQINKELRMSQNNEHLCRDCGRPMEFKEQPTLSGTTIPFVTCKNKDCTMWGVTLSTNEYERLTDTQFAEYRKMVANLKATIAKRSE